MKRLLSIILLVVVNQLLAQHFVSSSSLISNKAKYVLVIHGGAGNMTKGHLPDVVEKAYYESLNRALDTGQKILAKGGTALDAVEAVVKMMEDDPIFNAGKGAVFTNEGKNELDAAIMNGQTLQAGAVAGVTTIKNPISAARAVMEKTTHVMLTGKGAEKFAEQQGLTIVPASYFFTEWNWQGLLEAKAVDSLERNKKDSLIKKSKSYNQFRFSSTDVMGKFGTVGAVALDSYGNLAAATSTGGMTNKKYGRIGDSPIIGAGTYANNKTVAISCTGWGEYFIRLVIAKTVSDMMEFGKWSLQDASREMVLKRLPELGGDGGLIAVDKDGNIAMPFCTEGMFRGYVKNGMREVKIYKE